MKIYDNETSYYLKIIQQLRNHSNWFIKVQIYQYKSHKYQAFNQKEQHKIILKSIKTMFWNDHQSLLSIQYLQQGINFIAINWLIYKVCWIDSWSIRYLIFNNNATIIIFIFSPESNIFVINSKWRLQERHKNNS